MDRPPLEALLRQHIGNLEELSGRHPPLGARKEATRQRILAAATELFCERGYDRATMEEIAERAGVSRSTLYVYGSSKEDILIRSLAEEMRGEDISWLDALPEDPAELLRVLLVQRVVAVSRMPLMSLISQGDMGTIQVLRRRPDVTRLFDEEGWRRGLGAVIAEVAAGPLGPGEREELVAFFETLEFSAAGLIAATPQDRLRVERMAELLADAAVGLVKRAGRREGVGQRPPG
ncbi:MAG: TetR/AcrR family transcriptional regulator [Alphaproteobacteria bacterium]|nr:TetR/AcrR family transcriptional regulator [Alphaproteobacteria bacterium]